MAIDVGYFAREAVVNFRRNWVMSLGAVITIYLSLLLVGVSVATGVVVTNIVKDIEAKVSIQVFVKDGAAEGDREALQNAIASDPLVKGVKYTTKEQALEKFRTETMKGNEEIVDQLEGNPLPASLDVDLKDPREVEAMVSRIKAHPAFMKVIDRPDNPEKSLNYGQRTVERLFALTRIIRYVEVAFIVMLAGVSLIFISNTIRLAIYARRKEIGIMRLVGASNWFIRTPFLLEGVIQSMIGAGLAILTLALAQATVMRRVGQELPFLPVGIETADTVRIAAILILGGVVIGLMGSGFALRRYLKV